MSKEPREPRTGDIAYCRKGHLGVITCIEPEERNGEKVWTGVHLTGRKGKMVGSPWESAKPYVVIESEEFPTYCETLEKARKQASRV